MASKRWSGLNTYTVHEAQNASLGQGGSALITGTSQAVAPSGKTIVAITFLENSEFNSDTEGLVAEDPGLWVNSVSNSTDTITNCDVVDSEIFPAGTTIYGRWTSLKLASGKIMVYLG
tara:strand:- start:282 stop:635 length:354 start_codon:yes stop_codon:yes gene_type:complete